MMWNGLGYGGMFWGGGMFMGLFWLLIVGLVIWAIARISCRGCNIHHGC
jgi:hypothetical protein